MTLPMMRPNPFDVRTIVLAKHAQHVVLIHFPLALFIAVRSSISSRSGPSATPLRMRPITTWLLPPWQQVLAFEQGSVSLRGEAIQGRSL